MKKYMWILIFLLTTILYHIQISNNEIIESTTQISVDNNKLTESYHSILQINNRMCDNTAEIEIVYQKGDKISFGDIWLEDNNKKVINRFSMDLNDYRRPVRKKSVIIKYSKQSTKDPIQKYRKIQHRYNRRLYYSPVGLHPYTNEQETNI